MKPRPGKKKREHSPEDSQIKWRLKPTFLNLTSRKNLNREVRKEGDNEPENEKVRKVMKEGKEEQKQEKTKKSEDEQKGERKSEPESERKNKENKEKEESEGAARTPVRERIRRLNMRATASPGKFPLVKQQMIEEYFKKKSPKAKNNRSLEKPDSEQQTYKQGARDSPLEGDPTEERFCLDQAGSQSLPSRD